MIKNAIVRYLVMINYLLVASSNKMIPIITAKGINTEQQMTFIISVIVILALRAVKAASPDVLGVEGNIE